MSESRGFDPRPLVDLSGFQRDCLRVIAALDRPCGSDIQQQLEADYSTKINHGRLYPSLDTLVDKGLVAKGKVDRRTNWYGLTNRGMRELRSHRAWVAFKWGDSE